MREKDRVKQYIYIDDYGWEAAYRVVEGGKPGPWISCSDEENRKRREENGMNSYHDFELGAFDG